MRNVSRHFICRTRWISRLYHQHTYKDATLSLEGNLALKGHLLVQQLLCCNRTLSEQITLRWSSAKRNMRQEREKGKIILGCYELQCATSPTIFLKAAPFSFHCVWRRSERFKTFYLPLEKILKDAVWLSLRIPQRQLKNQVGKDITGVPKQWNMIKLRWEISLP